MMVLLQKPRVGPYWRAKTAQFPPKLTETSKFQNRISNFKFPPSNPKNEKIFLIDDIFFFFRPW
jgi:predicted amidophosphoribosyltransferase